MKEPDWYSDTDPKTLEVFIEVQRRMTPKQKVRRVFEMNAMLFRLQEADVRSLYPGAADREVFLRVTARRLDAETMRRVYGWDPGD